MHCWTVSRESWLPARFYRAVHKMDGGRLAWDTSRMACHRPSWRFAAQQGFPSKQAEVPQSHLKLSSPSSWPDGYKLSFLLDSACGMIESARAPAIRTVARRKTEECS